MEIQVNGERHQAPDGTTLMALVRSFDLDPSRLAIELDRAIVPRSKWEETSVSPGATVEIVQFVGGG